MVKWNLESGARAAPVICKFTGAGGKVTSRDSLPAGVFEDVNPVTNNLGIDGGGESGRHAGDACLVIGRPQPGEVEVQQVLAGIGKGSGDAGANRVAGGKPQDETMVLEGRRHRGVHIKHQAERRPMGGKGAQGPAKIGGIFD